MTVFATLRGMNNLFMFLLNILQVDLSGENLHNSKTKIAALLVAFVAFLMVATAFAGGLASPAVANPNPAQAASSSSSASGKMNLLTDLGNGNTLLQGDVGINLPGAIPTQFTQSPPVQISSISVSPSHTVLVGQPVLMSVNGIQGLPPYSYSWSLGNGNSASGNAVTVSYSAPGTYPIVATVTDAANNMASAYTNISVVAPLTVSLSPQMQTVSTGDVASVSYSVGGMQAGVNYTLSFNWHDNVAAYTGIGNYRTDSGSFRVNLTNGMGSGTLNYTYVTPGNFELTVDVSGNSQPAGNGIAYIVALADGFKASVSTVQSGPFYTGESIGFNITAQNGVPPYSGTLNFGDHSRPASVYITGTSEIVYHTYYTQGTYQVDLTLSDFNNTSASFMLPILIKPGILTANLYLNNNTSATSVIESAQQAITTPININATITGGTPSSSYGYHWYLYIASSSIAIAHGTAMPDTQFTAYLFKNTTPGTYIYNLEAVDSIGNSVYSNRVAITILSSALAMSISPVSGESNQSFVGSPYSLNGMVFNLQYNAKGYANFTVEINWGTGTAPTMQSFHESGTANAFFNFSLPESGYAKLMDYTYSVTGAYTITGYVNYIGNSTKVASNSLNIEVIQSAVSIVWGTSPSVPIITEPGIVDFFVNVTGTNPTGIFELANMYTGSGDGFFLSVGANITFEYGGIGHSYAAMQNNLTHQLPNGQFYFNFTFSVIYDMYSSSNGFLFKSDVNTVQNVLTDSEMRVGSFQITIDVNQGTPLQAQLFASATQIEVGQNVSFYSTIQNGTGEWEFHLFDPASSISSTQVVAVGAPWYSGTGWFYTDYHSYHGPHIYGYPKMPLSHNFTGAFQFNAAGVYPMTLWVEDDNGFHTLYTVDIQVAPALKVSISQLPRSNLVAPVGIAFAAQTSGGQGTVSYQWSLSVNGGSFAQVSTAQAFVGVFNAGKFLLRVNVSDSIGSMASANDRFIVQPSTTIEQVVSARVQATLFTAGGPTYYAYSGPAMWGRDGSLNATFAMPNVPALNAKYEVNVTYGYTVAITDFAANPAAYQIVYNLTEGNGYLSTLVSELLGSWQTYFYNVYSAQPYASQTLTVVAGGQILSESQLQAGVSTLSAQINGVNTNLSVDTSSLMTALQSGFKTVNNGIVTIEAQGSQIEASLAAINASIKSVSAGVSGLSGSLSADTATLSTSIGTIQTSLANLNATVTSVSSTIGAVKGAQVTLSTDVGTLSGDITNVSNGVATIQTTAGQIKVAVGQIQGSANAIQSGMSTVELLLVVLIVLMLITLAVALFSVSRSNALAKKLNGKGKNGGSGGMPPAGGSTMLVAVQPVRKNYRKLK